MKFELTEAKLSLHTQVYYQLKEYIISGQLKPGECLIEQTIAAQMSISKTPVREALRELVQEGLVVHHPRKGVTVMDITENDIEEITSLRAVIEGFGIGLYVSASKEDDKERLQEIVDEIYLAEKEKNYAKTADFDLKFHSFIIERTGHSRLIKAWKTLESQTRILLQMIEYYKIYQGYSGDSHKKLLDIIFAGDTEGAIVAVKDHILESGKNIVKNFKERKAAGIGSHGEKNVI